MIYFPSLFFICYFQIFPLEENSLYMLVNVIFQGDEITPDPMIEIESRHER